MEYDRWRLSLLQGGKGQQQYCNAALSSVLKARIAHTPTKLKLTCNYIRTIAACYLRDAGLLLILAHHTVLTQQQELLDIPVVALYPPLKPIDTGYPANIPTNVPTQLGSAPPILTSGPTTACSTTVSAVLQASKRTLLARHLAATPQGQQILSGAMQATVLAPSDEAMSYLLAAQQNGLSGPQAASSVALYHALQGTLPLSKLRKTYGLWWNTTLTKASCPTASQTVTIYSGGLTTYVRSATNTARVTAGDLQACNSVVHLLDHALQPCCASLFEELPRFSIVKIQPSFFEGYRAPEPAENTDGFNRRLFEEAMVDLLLFSGPINNTQTVLWPSQSAWDNFNLASLLPGIAVDMAVRTQAMQLLALYSSSYTRVIMPHDIPGEDGTAPAINFPFITALKNITAKSLWSCGDVLMVSAPAWVSPLHSTIAVQQATVRLTPETVVDSPAPEASMTTTGPELSSTSAAGIAASTGTSSGVSSATDNSAGGIMGSLTSLSPEPSTTSSSGTAIIKPVGSYPSSTAGATVGSAASTSKAAGETSGGSGSSTSRTDRLESLVTRRLLEQMHAAAEPKHSQAELHDTQQGLRRLQAAAGGDSKTVNVVDFYETCEGIRVLVIDAVPVPCDFVKLVQNFGNIQKVIDNAYVPKEYRTLAAAMYEWLLQKGVIKRGQSLSSVKDKQANSAGQPGVQWQWQSWTAVLIMACLSWQMLL